jgi:uncharacterized protein
MGLLGEIVGSRTRAEIFRLLFQGTETEIYLREIQRRAKLSVRPIQQELSRLQKIGLVKARKDGNRLYFSANPAHPIYPEIRKIVEKTEGVQGLLRDALSDPDVKIAFIFGSVATGKERAESDVDLFVIGELGLRKLSKLLSGVSGRVGREVNPHVYSEADFAAKWRARDHFVTRVTESEKIFVAGSEDDLKRLGTK